MLLSKIIKHFIILQPESHTGGTGGVKELHLAPEPHFVDPCL